MQVSLVGSITVQVACFSILSLSKDAVSRRVTSFDKFGTGPAYPQDRPFGLLKTILSRVSVG
jgi:hypothetical protein